MSSFKVEISSNNPLLWHFNIYATIIAYDEDENIVSYRSEVDDKSSHWSAAVRHPFVIESGDCHHAELHLYVIAAIFPDSVQIALSPPFEAQMRIETDGDQKTIPIMVNQWGGYTLSGYKLSTEG